jgi:hypothetical protein
MTTRYYTTDEIAKIWTAAWYDAIACGYSEAFADKHANDKVAHLRRLSGA